MAEPDIETIVHPGVALHLDGTFFPVLCVTWFGTPQVAAIDEYVQWLGQMAARAREEGTKVAILGDISGLDERPGPKSRRYLARAIDELGERHSEVLLGGATIISDGFMRAVVSMVLALTRKKFQLEPVKSFEAALEHVFGLLDEAGVARPEGLEGRSRPERPQ